MIFLFVTMSLLIMNYSSGDIIVNKLPDKLWANVEHQLEELTKKQELQKTKINGLKGLLREEGVDFTENPILNDENDNDPYAYAIISNIRNGFDLLKTHYKQEITGFTDHSSSGNLITNHSKEYCTKVSLYTFIPITGTEFRFKLRAPSNGHIALTHSPLEVPMYEVLLGGSGNKKSVIRKEGNVELTKITHGRLLNECDFMGFWIRWNDNVLSVGYETDEEPLMQINASDLFKVNYIGLHTYDRIGNWIIN